MNTYFNTNNIVDSPILIRTSRISLGSCALREEPSAGIVTASPEGSVDLTYGVDACSGCRYPLTDPFKNLTDFRREDLNPEDYPTTLNWNLFSARYKIDSNLIDHFSGTFSNNLSGEQLLLAYIAFTMEEYGYKFIVLAHSSETALINFCQQRGWHCRVIDT